MTTLAMGPTASIGTASLDRAVAWGQAADISARSTLVTILGDTVAPLGGTVWLADVIALAEPFGFNDRLVRTSMFRLAAEGWVVSERVGRRSRYSLTDYGREETRAAEQRIYRPRERNWDGSWTLVFLADASDELVRHLRWRGFARMADGVHVHPNDSVAETRHLLDRLGVEPAPPVAAARFDGDGEAPIAGSPFRTDSGLAEAEAAYRRFLERYADTGIGSAPGTTADAGADPAVEVTVDADLDVVGLEPRQAFALRTMVVHDLRRARLRDPDLPAALLPDDWVGHRAVELATDLHRSITDAAWRFVEQITGLTVTDENLVADRFVPAEPPDHRADPETEAETARNASPADQGDRQ